MGLGDAPAGETPAGVDLPEVTAIVSQAYARALLFDLETREFVRNADGSLATVHPIDAAVAFSIGFALKNIPAAPEVGFDREKLRRVSAAARQSLTEDVVRTALKRLTASNDVTITHVAVEGLPSGLAAEISYINHRLSDRAPVVLQLR
jgi:hypothetical protein